MNARHLYRVRRRNRADQIKNVRVVFTHKAAQHQAERWAAWPSTRRVEIHRIDVAGRWTQVEP